MPKKLIGASAVIVAVLTLFIIFGKFHSLGRQTAAVGDTTTDLVAHYTLDGGSVTDSVGSYNGTAKNSPGSGPGVVGTAMTFDGTQVVEIPSISALQNIPAITISTWVKGAGDFNPAVSSGYSVV